MKFIYLDECKDIAHTNIVSLTGVLIDSEHYKSLRERFYETLNCYIQPEPQTINLSPPEIHGSCLLPDAADDNERLRVLTGLADAIVEAKARIYRVGYYATEELLSSFGGEDGLLSLCLFGIKDQCQPEYANHILMPVMDSVNEPVFEAFSRSIRCLDIMRSSGFDETSMSFLNTENLCEMHFADSEHSALIQISDIVSYLLHAEDFERCGLKVTSFKKKLISISKSLSPSIIKNEVIKMKNRT